MNPSKLLLLLSRSSFFRFYCYIFNYTFNLIFVAY